MAFSAADLTAIEQALATGELEVEINGKRIKYRSVPDLLAARNTIRADLQASGIATQATRTSYASRVRN